MKKLRKRSEKYLNENTIWAYADCETCHCASVCTNGKTNDNDNVDLQGPEVNKN